MSQKTPSASSRRSSSESQRSRRPSAQDIYRYSFAEATLPSMRPQRALQGDAERQLSRDMEEIQREIEEREAREREEQLRYVRLPHMPFTDSMIRLSRGEQLCMCAALGQCPLMAHRHPPPCDLCASPFVTRYYPTDLGWWNLRSQVKAARSSVNMEDERPPTEPLPARFGLS